MHEALNNHLKQDIYKGKEKKLFFSVIFRTW